MAEVSTNCSENQRIETVYEMDTHYYIFSPKGILYIQNQQQSNVEGASCNKTCGYRRQSYKGADA